jgi:hypothetical protein
MPPPMPAHTLWLSGKGTEQLTGATMSSQSVLGNAGFRPSLPEGECHTRFLRQNQVLIVCMRRGLELLPNYC